MTPSPQAHAELRKKATRALLMSTDYSCRYEMSEINPEALIALLDELDAEHENAESWKRCAFRRDDRIAALEAQVAAVNAVLAEGCEGPCDYGSCAECDCSNDEPCNINGDEDKFCLRCLIQARMKASIDKLALTRYPQGAATKE